VRILSDGMNSFRSHLVEGLEANEGRINSLLNGDHHGLEDVKLELAVHATDGGSDVITHNLGADHGACAFSLMA
jgi:hypothetical protein